MNSSLSFTVFSCLFLWIDGCSSHFTLTRFLVALSILFSSFFLFFLEFFLVYLFIVLENEIPETICTSFFESLSGYRYLRELSFAGNGLSGNNALYLLQKIDSIPSLIHLDLSGEFEIWKDCILIVVVVDVGDWIEILSTNTWSNTISFPSFFLSFSLFCALARWNRFCFGIENWTYLANNIDDSVGIALGESLASNFQLESLDLSGSFIFFPWTSAYSSLSIFWLALSSRADHIGGSFDFHR